VAAEGAVSSCAAVVVVRSFCTALKPPAPPMAGAASGRESGLRPVPSAAAPDTEGSTRRTGLARQGPLKTPSLGRC
jgi:hypothetical protein